MIAAPKDSPCCCSARHQREEAAPSCCATRTKSSPGKPKVCCADAAKHQKPANNDKTLQKSDKGCTRAMVPPLDSMTTKVQTLSLADSSITAYHYEAIDLVGNVSARPASFRWAAFLCPPPTELIISLQRFLI
jgi:hypothetical protein